MKKSLRKAVDMIHLAKAHGVYFLFLEIQKHIDVDEINDKCEMREAILAKLVEGNK